MAGGRDDSGAVQCRCGKRYGSEADFLLDWSTSHKKTCPMSAAIMFEVREEVAADPSKSEPTVLVRVACGRSPPEVGPAASSAANSGDGLSLSMRYRLEDYTTVGSPLGGGSFGQVTKVVHKSSGQYYAMKAIPKKKIVDHKMTDYLWREVQTQMKLKHPNILVMYYYFEDADNVHLLLEYARGGSLFGTLRKRGRLPEPEAARYFTHVSLALDYLHHKGVIHRDLKPENILMCDNSVAKLADFGWCAEIDERGERNTFCGTWDYLSPEMVNNEPHDHTVDVWAVGVLLYEMLTARAPFAAASQMKTLMRISGVDLQPPSHVPSDAKDLMQMLLVKEKSARLPLAQAIQHPWIQQHVPAEEREVRVSVEEASERRDKSEILPSATAHGGPAGADHLAKSVRVDDKIGKSAKIEKSVIFVENEEARVLASPSAASPSDETCAELPVKMAVSRMTTQEFRQARDAAIRAEEDVKRSATATAESSPPASKQARSPRIAKSVETAPTVTTSPTIQSTGILSASALLRSALQTEGDLPSTTPGFFDAIYASASNVVAGIGLGDSTPSAASAADQASGGGAQSEPVVRSRRRHRTEGDVLARGRAGGGQSSKVLGAALISLEGQDVSAAGGDTLAATDTKASKVRIEDPLAGTANDSTLGGTLPMGDESTMNKTSSRAAFRTIRNKLQSRAIERKLTLAALDVTIEETGGPERPDDPASAGAQSSPPDVFRRDAGQKMRTLIARDTGPSAEFDGIDETRPVGAPRDASVDSEDFSPPLRRVRSNRDSDGHAREKSTPAFARRGECHEDLPASSLKRSNSESFLAEAVLMERTLSGMSRGSSPEARHRVHGSPTMSPASPPRAPVQHQLSWELNGVM